MKRNYFYNGYGEGGLRMIDIEAFSKAQKLVWAKNLLDTDYNGLEDFGVGCPWEV